MVLRDYSLRSAADVILPLSDVSVTNLNKPPRALAASIIARVRKELAPSL